MAYTKEFIEKIKRVYPNSEKMKELAEKGDYILGRYLYDGRENGVSPEFILTHNYDECVAAAKQIKEKDELYRKWANNSCYVGGADRKNYCPINHMQNCSEHLFTVMNPTPEGGGLSMQHPAQGSEVQTTEKLSPS